MADGSMVKLMHKDKFELFFVSEKRNKRGVDEK